MNTRKRVPAQDYFDLEIGMRVRERHGAKRTGEITSITDDDQIVVILFDGASNPTHVGGMGFCLYFERAPQAKPKARTHKCTCPCTCGAADT